MEVHYVAKPQLEMHADRTWGGTTGIQAQEQHEVQIQQSSGAHWVYVEAQSDLDKTAEDGY